MSTDLHHFVPTDARTWPCSRVILFHELAHLLFEHPLTEVAGVGGLRGFLVSDADDALAEAFAVGAMQYSFLETDASPH